MILNDLDQATDRQCEQLLHPWCGAGDVPPAFPLTEAQVIDVLRVGGYAIDPAGVDYLRGLGVCYVPADGRWAARDVLRFAGYLDSRRQWAAAPNAAKDGLKTSCQVLLEQAQAGGTVGEVVKQFRSEGIDLRAALLLLTESDVRALREQLLAAVLAFLHDLGVEV